MGNVLCTTFRLCCALRSGVMLLDGRDLPHGSVDLVDVIFGANRNGYCRDGGDI